MRKALIGEEFRSEHDEKDDEEECVPCQVRRAFSGTQATPDESPGLSEEEEESGEETGADDGVEDGIGRVVVTEILVADEIVFDEGEPESFGEGPEWVAVIHFGRKDGYVLGSIREMMGVPVEIVEHRARDDERGEDERERVSPVSFQEILIREHEEWEEEDEDDGREAEGNIGVDAESEDASGKDEEQYSFRP